MTDTDPTARVDIVYPHRMGWLRRPELEKEGSGEVWELPDGRLFHWKGTGPLLIQVIK